MKSLIVSLSITLLLLFVSCAPDKESTDNHRTPEISWKLASSFPNSFDAVYGQAESFSKRVSELTNGNFTIRTYQGGELIGPLDVFDAVQSGAIEMGQSAGFYYTGKDETLVFDSGIPFGLTPRQQNAWLYYGGGLDLLQKAYKKHKILYLPGGNTGHQMGGWFNKDVANLSSLSGLRIRIPGYGGEIFNRLGATVQMIPGGEIYTSLERGAIDATEWLGPYDDLKAGLNEIAKKYYYPNWWEIGTTVALYINVDKWNELPDSYKSAIEVAASEANLMMLSHFDHNNSEALQLLTGKHTDISEFPEDFIKAARSETMTLLSEKAIQNEEFRVIYESWKAYQIKQQEWFKLSYK